MEDINYSNIAAVVPVLNPEPGLIGLVKDLCNCFSVVLIVDDGSDENINEFKKVDARAKIVHHDKNIGKGAAIKTAFKWLQKNSPTVRVAVFVDGDGQHRVEDARSVARNALRHDCVTLGVRDFGSGVPFRSKFGNVCTAFLVRMIYRLKISDTQTGLRAIPSRLFSCMLAIPGDRYEYEMRLFGVMHALQESIEQVSISTIYIENNRASHFRPVRDSIKVYHGLFGCGFFKFICSSLLGFCVDNVVFTVLIYTFQWLSFSRNRGIFYALIAARVVSATINYVCNRVFVFSAKASCLKSFLRYWVLVVVIATLSYGLTTLTSNLVDATGIVVTLLKIIVETVIFLLSYFAQKKWVFSK